MADVSNIVVLGFGSWSSVNKLPTLGFSIGQITVPSVPGLEYTVSASRLHYTVPTSRLQYTETQHRLHYTVPEA